MFEKFVSGKAEAEDIESLLHALLLELEERFRAQRGGFIDLEGGPTDESLMSAVAEQLTDLTGRVRRITEILDAGSWRISVLLSKYALRALDRALEEIKGEENADEVDNSPTSDAQEEKIVELDGMSPGELWDMMFLMVWELAKKRPKKVETTGGLDYAKGEVEYLIRGELEESITELSEIPGVIDLYVGSRRLAIFHLEASSKLLRKSLAYLDVSLLVP